MEKGLVSSAPRPKERYPGEVNDSLIQDPLGTLTRIAKECGDVAYFELEGEPVAFLNHPELIKDVCAVRYRSFAKTEGFKHIAPPSNLLVTEGESHHRLRKMMQPMVHQERMNAAVGTIVGDARELCDSWKAGRDVDLRVEMTDLNQKTQLKYLLSIDIDNLSDPRHREFAALFERELLVTETLGYKQARWQLKDYPPHEETKKALHRWFDEEIRKRRQNGDEHDDILSMLLKARDDQGNALTDEEVRDQFDFLLVAGRENVANSITWTFYLLSQNPEAEAKLYLEIDSVLNGRLPMAEDYPKLRYVSQVYNESMRIYPPAWTVARKAATDLSLGSYTIPRDTMLLMCQYVTHHDARWFPDPERFLPERWGSESASKLPKIAYFPFAAGPHVCIGEPLVRLEAVLVIATIAQRWMLRLAKGARVELGIPSAEWPWPPKNGTHTGLQPKYGMLMTPDPREVKST